MTFNYALQFLFTAATVCALTACPGQDESSSQDGLALHIGEVHFETPLSATSTSVASALASTAIPQALTSSGGYERSNLEHHDVIDGAGHLLSLYRAYLIVDDIAPVKCITLTDIPSMLLDTLISTAHAHAGHGSEPVGGRNLDRPNVIDIITQDEFYLALGDLAVAPGSYCGLRLFLNGATDQAYGKPNALPASQDDPTTFPEIPELTGEALSIRADYCASDDGLGNCLLRTKIDIDEYASKAASAIYINFDQPIIVDGTKREAFAAIGINYGEWFKDVDATLLPSDTGERQKLMQNIADSLRIYGKGYGALPANTPGS